MNNLTRSAADTRADGGVCEVTSPRAHALTSISGPSYGLLLAFGFSALAWGALAWWVL